MQIEGTEPQISFGFALAGLFLSTELLAAAVQRGERSAAEASALYGAAQARLTRVLRDFPCDPAAKEIAATLLRLMEQMIPPHTGPARAH